VTVGREADKVKPNGKKRMNLRAVAHVSGVRAATCPSPAHLTGSLTGPGVSGRLDHPQ